MHPERAGLAEHAANGAVLAGGVGALEHDQQTKAPVGIEEVLQAVDLVGELGHPLLVGCLVAR